MIAHNSIVPFIVQVQLIRNLKRGKRTLKKGLDGTTLFYYPNGATAVVFNGTATMVQPWDIAMTSTKNLWPEAAKEEALLGQAFEQFADIATRPIMRKPTKVQKQRLVEYMQFGDPFQVSSKERKRLAKKGLIV